MSSLQFKASTDGSNEPVDQAIIKGSLFKMTSKDRLKLGDGPTFTLQVGETTITREFPKRAAMGMSVFWNEVLSKHGHSSVIMLHPSQVNEKQVRVLTDYIVSNSKTKNPFSIRVPETLCELVELYRHTQLFGMSVPAGDLRSRLLDHLRSNESVSYVALESMVKLSATDVCYKAVVRKIEGLVHIGCLDNDEEWKSWVSCHPSFAADMSSWQAERRKRQKDAKIAQKKINWEKDFPPLV